MNPRPLLNPTHAFGQPADWDPKEQGGRVSTLHVIFDGKAMQSLWKPSPEELKDLANGGCMVLSVYGSGHPVVSLGAISPERAAEFVDTTQEDQIEALQREMEESNVN